MFKDKLTKEDGSYNATQDCEIKAWYKFKDELPSVTKEEIAVAIRNVDLGEVVCAHEYINGSNKLANAVMQVLIDNNIIVGE